MTKNYTREEIKEMLFVRETVRQLYNEIKDVPTIAKLATEIFSAREEGAYISEENVRKQIAAIERDSLLVEKETDVLVDSMLKSIGQNLEENEEKAEEKKKGLFDKNSPENHLRFCEVLVDKEAEGVQHG